MMQEMLLGTFNTKWEGHISDMNGREMATVIPLIVIMFFVGIYPKPLMDMMNTSLVYLLTLVK